MDGTDIKKEYISIDEASKITGLSIQTIRKLGDKKQIKCFNLSEAGVSPVIQCSFHTFLITNSYMKSILFVL
jgi:hypothetical protein